MRTNQIRAEGETDIKTEPERITLEVVEASRAKVKGIAYSGRAMKLPGVPLPVVVDLDGLTFAANVPLLTNHENRTGSRVGIVRPAVRAGVLYIEGEILSSSGVATGIVEQARNGADWELSIGADVVEKEIVEGTRVINGKEQTGPFIYVKRAVLREVSVVAVGADQGTHMRLAAKFFFGGGAGMSYEQWLAQHGIQAAGLSDEDKTRLKAAYDGGQEPPADLLPKQKVKAKASTSSMQTSGRTAVELDDDTNSVIQAARQERERRRKITDMVRDAIARPGSDLDRLEAISNEAIRGNWSVRDTELALMRAERPNVGPIRREAPPTQQVLAAALLMTCGISDEALAKDRDFGERIVNAAWKRRGSGLHSMFASALESDGISAPHGGDALYRAVIEHQIRAGFSSIDLSGLLGTVGNKILLDSFTRVNTTYERLAQQSDFNNFLTYTNYRLDHTGEFAEVGSTGELKHGALTEGSYTNKLATRGQMLTLPRQAIVNDDLNALQQLYGTLGRKARIAVEKALYDQIMESSDVFYTAARGNLVASNGLSVEALGAAEAALLGMVDADGEPIFASPTILLVPPGLKYLGEQLYTSATVNQTPASNKSQGVNNPYRGRFTPESSPYLALSTMTGYSATTWYLLADPASMPAFQVAYLQGRRQPTIETSDAAFNTLGIQMRCYFDFGVAQLDYRGAVKCTA